jgi:precorrin-3B C17-methyltransferase
MAAAVFEAVDNGDPTWRSLDIRIEPGITAMLAAAARVGAPLGGDFCAMSLSDNLKPWEIVEARLRAALTADFAIALYNPISSARPWQLGEAFKIVAGSRGPDTPIILARAVMRPDERIRIVPLSAVEASMADMSTVVIIGASTTKLIERSEGEEPYVYTPRFYGVRP